MPTLALPGRALIAVLLAVSLAGACEPSTAPDCRDPGFSWSDHRPAINARHVFCGEVRDGKPKGFHSTRLMDTSDEVTGVRGISRYANGIYSGTVVFKDGQTKFSTFFPDACSADDILASIHHASTHIGGEHPAWGYLGPSAPAGGTDGFCLDDRGQAFEIRMGLFGDGRVNTAFPNR